MASLFLPYDLILCQARIPSKRLLIHDLNEKPILFYGEAMNYRIYNLIKLLKDEGRSVYWLTTNYKKKVHSDLSKFQIFTRNKYHSIRILGATNIPVMIYFASNARFCSNGIECFNGVKFFDNYDNYILYYGYNCEHKFSKDLLVAERNCFEQADYVIARNLEVNQALRKYKLIDKEKLFIPDSCNSNRFQQSKKLKGNKISLVYCGGLYGQKEKSFTHGFDDFSILYDSLIENDLSIHLYPNPQQFPIHYQSIMELSQENKNIFLYKSVPNDLLVEEISKYDFGIIPHYKTNESTISEEKLMFASSNKFMNFLEAGIPIIVTNEMKFMAWIVKRYQIGIVVDKTEFNNLRNVISSYDYSLLCDNVYKTRTKFVFDNKYEKLKQLI